MQCRGLCVCNSNLIFIYTYILIVASEASELYEMPFIFHPHNQWSSFKSNGVGGGEDGGEGAEFGALTTGR